MQSSLLRRSLLGLAALGSLVMAGIEAVRAQDPYRVGLILVGPRQDGGWNQAHVLGGEYVSQQLPGVTFDVVDKVNPADRPNVKGSQVADDLIAKGAKTIIFNSDDFKDDALETAKKHPEVTVIHASGDYAWKDGKNFKDQANLGNIMPKMEYTRMISGCAAALGSETGKIGFVGPLINDETRRYVSAAYLGAKHCWETYRGKNAEDLDFRVVWIGFWFNIPGVTLDPTKVADDFFNGGYDVVMSGLDTPEVAVQARKAAESGKAVKFTHYGLKTGCELAPELCLGVPYYNWGPSYRDAIAAARQGQYQSAWVWSDVDWTDINNVDTTGAGFMPGDALGDQAQNLDAFIAALGKDPNFLYAGPLTFQDGTEFLKEGEAITPSKIWYMPQLLSGIDGPSQ
ncbi:MAG: BMP family ABC transporter substrate-binding protein [Synechococcales cyanobacterium]